MTENLAPPALTVLRGLTDAARLGVLAMLVRMTVRAVADSLRAIGLTLVETYYLIFGRAPRGAVH